MKEVTENSGTLAHASVQLWIQERGYRAEDSRAALDRAIASTLPAGQPPPPDWAVCRARLRARATELAAVLRAEPNARVICETELRDKKLRIRGTPDVIVVGKTLALIDLKTQTLKGDSLPAAMRFQLAIYLHLVEQTYGSTPTEVAVFSLNRGIIPVDLTVADIAAALDAVARARAADPFEAHPDLEICRFCRRRMECQPHWDAAASWPVSDCVEGTIERVEIAANGSTALGITTANGVVWASGLPCGLFTHVLGDYVRLARVRHVSDGENAASERRWRPNSILSRWPPDQLPAQLP